MTGVVGSEHFEGSLCPHLQEFGILGTLDPYIITLKNLCGVDFLFCYESSVCVSHTCLKI